MYVLSRLPELTAVSFAVPPSRLRTPPTLTFDGEMSPPVLLVDSNVEMRDTFDARFVSVFDSLVALLDKPVSRVLMSVSIVMML
jgi:hypothetical protein